MTDYNQFVVFTLDGQQFSLPVSAVERILPVVLIEPIPNAPGYLSGVTTVLGHIIPVLNLRRLLQLPEREIAISDHLLLVTMHQRTVAIVVDSIRGLVESQADDLLQTYTVTPESVHVSSIMKLADGVNFVLDLESFLSTHDEALFAAVNEGS